MPDNCGYVTAMSIRLISYKSSLFEIKKQNPDVFIIFLYKITYLTCLWGKEHFKNYRYSNFVFQNNC